MLAAEGSSIYTHEKNTNLHRSCTPACPKNASYSPVVKKVKVKVVLPAKRWQKNNEETWTLVKLTWGKPDWVRGLLGNSHLEGYVWPSEDDAKNDWLCDDWVSRQVHSGGRK